MSPACPVTSAMATSNSTISNPAITRERRPKISMAPPTSSRRVTNQASRRPAGNPADERNSPNGNTGSAAAELVDAVSEHHEPHDHAYDDRGEHSQSPELLRESQDRCLHVRLPPSFGL